MILFAEPLEPKAFAPFGEVLEATGEADKIDGIYYAFKLIQRMRRVLPQWFPLVGFEGSELHVVPVDYVAQAIDAIAHNVGVLRERVAPAALWVVVKADGYGHGAVEVAREALRNGAQYLGVARINEAIPLRKAGLEAPILIFGYSPPDLAPLLIDYDLTQTVYSLSTASALSALATRKQKKINIHLKVDSGMGRLGLVLNEATTSNLSAQQSPDPVQ